MYARRISLAVIALLAVLIALPGQVSAASAVPFRAKVAETFTAAPCSPVPSLCISAVGRGHATHLGHISESVVINLASNPAPACAAETRETILTAKNGDRIILPGSQDGSYGTLV